MKKVMQYLLKDVNVHRLELPVGSTILDIQVLNGDPTIFVLEDMDQKQSEVRTLHRIRSGDSVTNEVDGYVYIGSVLVLSFGYAYHIFEEIHLPKLSDLSPVFVDPNPVADITVETVVSQREEDHKTPPAPKLLDAFKRK